ncbi:MAG: hypothetical protein KC776_20480 [Myxococcales bacterium]|nr:hypothetical protein [Myxococcales bacterium]
MMKHSILLKVVPAAALMGAVVSQSAPAEAQSRCISGTRVLSDLASNYGDKLIQYHCNKRKDPAKCLEDAGKVQAVVSDSVKYWNKMAGNGWATIGPRELTFNGKLDGKVVLGSERLFVTKAPVFDTDRIAVTILKEGGKANTRVTIAKFDENGRCLDADEVTFSGKDKKGTTKSVRLKGVKGMFVAVKINASGGKAFDYELRANNNPNRW